MRLAVLFLMVLFLSAPAFAQDEKREYPVPECDPRLSGDWLCKHAKAKGERLVPINLSLETNSNGVTRLTRGVGGKLFCHNGHCVDEHDSWENYVADGRRHATWDGISYASSCNHRTKTKGHKVFRIAYRLDAGKVGIREYFIMSDGRMAIARFFGTMDGWDVKNSDRPRETSDYSICIRDYRFRDQK